MRKIIPLLLFAFFPFCIVFGQNAVLHISIANGKATNCSVNIPSQPKDGSFNLTFKDGRTASHTFKLIRPEFVQLISFDTDDWEHKHFNYLLYLSPGDDLDLEVYFNEPDFGFKVSGKGSNNNQPLISTMESADLHNFYRDTLPYRVINVINAAQKTQENNLDKYIKLYNPSPSYINDWKINLRYYAGDLYYNFKAINKNYVWQAYYRNYAQWQKITDSLFRVAKPNNDAALATFHYSELITGVLYGERVHLADEEYLNPEAFYWEWYHTDTVEGKKLFNEDPKNLVKEKIINKYFTEKTAEYLYAVLFAGAANDSYPNNIPEIFGRFKEKYPNSEYIAQFSQYVDTIIAKQKQALNKRMVFMADNGTKLNSLDDVLTAMKGKTVLVDMWGTWCSPCREEIEKHTTSIHEHFKGKKLDYLYIANYDLKNNEQWKKLIAYFNLEGVHIMANEDLTKDIMAKVKGQGFPTMFIIKANGTIEQSKTQYPINEDILIGQLEAALQQ